MHKNFARDSPPPFLQGVLDYAQFHERAGEWVLDLPALTIAGGHFFPMQWLAPMIGQFQVAFPWTTFRKITVGVDGQAEPVVWEEQCGLQEDWLAELVSSDMQCGGVETTLDLAVRWVAPDGAIGDAVLPEAAEFWFDVKPSRALRCVLTIWPNVFTDDIYIYEGESRGRMQRRSISFGPAAHLNRTRLRASLRDWERLTGGQLEISESESVNGIERYGFAEDAMAL